MERISRNPGKTRSSASALLVLTAALLTALVAAQPGEAPSPEGPAPVSPVPHPQGYVCYRMAAPPVKDGKLNDPRDTDRAWSVEIAFPWEAFRRSQAAAGDRWRVNFSRVEWAVRVVGGHYEKLPGRKEDNWVWSPQHVVNMHRPETWGYVEFSQARPGSVGFTPDPLWRVKEALHAAYYAQREHWRKTGRYAATPGELGMDKRGLGLEKTSAGYTLRLGPCELNENSALRCGGR